MIPLDGDKNGDKMDPEIPIYPMKVPLTSTIQKSPSKTTIAGEGRLVGLCSCGRHQGMPQWGPQSSDSVRTVA